MRTLDPAIKPAASEVHDCEATAQSYPNGCPGCGAPMCCEQCCRAESAQTGFDDFAETLIAQATGRDYVYENDTLTSAEAKRAIRAAIASIREADVGRLRLALEAIVEETGHLHLLSHAQARAALDTQGVW